MKYKRIYTISGTNKKADDTDYISKYIAENGKVIEIMELVNSPMRWYRVDGKEFDTLKAAKNYVECIKYREGN